MRRRWHRPRWLHATMRDARPTHRSTPIARCTGSHGAGTASAASFRSTGSPRFRSAARWSPFPWESMEACAPTTRKRRGLWSRTRTPWPGASARATWSCARSIRFRGSRPRTSTCPSGAPSIPIARRTWPRSRASSAPASAPARSGGSPTAPGERSFSRSSTRDSRSACATWAPP